MAEILFVQTGDLREDPGNAREPGFSVRRAAKQTPDVLDGKKTGAVGKKAEPEFIIHSEIEGVIDEVPGSFVNPTPPEGRFLGDVARLSDQAFTERPEQVALEVTPVLVDALPMTADHIDFGVSGEALDHLGDGVGAGQAIVRIQVAQDVTRGQAEAAIEGVGLAFVLFDDQHVEPGA